MNARKLYPIFEVLKPFNDSFPKSTLGILKHACSVPILFSISLLLATPVRTRFPIRFPNASEMHDACMQNKPNNCTTVLSLKESLLSLSCFKLRAGLYGLSSDHGWLLSALAFLLSNAEQVTNCMFLPLSKLE